MPTRQGILAALAAAVLAAVLAAPAEAHRRRPPPRPWEPAFDTYLSFKAGGFGADGLDVDGEGDWGLFLGVEWGIAPVPNLELGMTFDWFHRDDTRGTTVFVDDPFAPPVHFVADEGTSADLLPLGAVIRARFPVGDGRIAPFVAGHLGWDALRLRFRSVATSGSTAYLIESTEWFYGMGAGVSAGAEAAVGPGVDLVFEAGLRESEPHRDLIVNGIPVQARVDADGQYVRAGVKLTF